MKAPGAESLPAKAAPLNVMDSEPRVASLLVIVAVAVFEVPLGVRVTVSV